MPFVNIRTFKGALSSTEKRELQNKISDLLVEYEGKGNPEFKKFVWVMLEEEPPQNWMLGGAVISDILDSNPAYKEIYLENLKEENN